MVLKLFAWFSSLLDMNCWRAETLFVHSSSLQQDLCSSCCVQALSRVLGMKQWTKQIKIVSVWSLHFTLFLLHRIASAVYSQPVSCMCVTWSKLLSPSVLNFSPISGWNYHFWNVWWLCRESDNQSLMSPGFNVHLFVWPPYLAPIISVLVSL